MPWEVQEDFDPKKTVRRHLDRVATRGCPDGLRRRLLASTTIEDDVYYAAVECLDQLGIEWVEAVICPYRLRMRGPIAGPNALVLEYNRMTDEDGPAESDCPTEILELVTRINSEPAADWVRRSYASPRLYERRVKYKIFRPGH